MAAKPKTPAKTGRPTAYRKEYVKQAEKLCALGATDPEIADFFSIEPSEDDWLLLCLVLIREDRRGVIADQKRKRSKSRNARLQASPSQRIRNSISARMWAALKGKTDGALFSRLGYSSDQLVSHLEAQFLDGMGWDNYGAWHVDHVKPCALFDLTDAAQFSECWGLNNLAPLWAEDNIRKGAKYGSA